MEILGKSLYSLASSQETKVIAVTGTRAKPFIFNRIKKGVIVVIIDNAKNSLKLAKEVFKI